MSKTLERDLGLFAVITISFGAMIGSGIFVLPGIASVIAGPAVILAYLLAGLIVFPAALSKAEMATAMPESGGTYLYIDRGMGPLMGSIAGFGAWFSLVFKSAFALVGLGAYVLLFSSLEPQVVGFILGIFLIALNIVGVKQTARLQMLVVSAVVVILILYILEGITWVEQENYHPFFSKGLDGLLAATGFVFVSYAGVTKIASVAEEVENPGQNIPIGMIMSISVMMVIYTLITFVIVGLTQEDLLGRTLTPMADAAESFLGEAGVIIVAVTAVLALTGMANAGILSASRYPFAMSRDKLAPGPLQKISPRFKTPVLSITVTGAGVLILIATVPVVEIAKLASAFQILVFSFENLALIAFRESSLESYRPTFRAPGYPWVQLFGIFGGGVLLTQMGWLPIIGAAGIIVVGFLSYRAFGKETTTREGASLDALRRTAASRFIRTTREEVKGEGEYRILVPVHSETDERTETDLIRLASAFLGSDRGEIQVIRFVEVPDQITLDVAASEQSPEEIEFERHTQEIAGEVGVEVQVGEVVSHDRKRAVRNYVQHRGIDLVLTAVGGQRHFRFFTGNIGWFMEKVAADSVFLRNRLPEKIKRVAVLGSGGPYDALKVRLANSLALEGGGSIRFLHILNEGASQAQLDSIRNYHEQLESLCSAPTESIVERSGTLSQTLTEYARRADLVIVGASDQRFFKHRFFTELTDRLARDLDNPVLVVFSKGSFRRSSIGNLLERFFYGQN